MKSRKQKARPCESGQVLDFLVPLDGIELSTFALRMRKKWHFLALKGMRGKDMFALISTS
jgi:hypothetical protein